MSTPTFRDRLEHHQVVIYFAAVVIAAAVGAVVPGADTLEGAINPTLALMLFVTFLQVPLADLGRAYSRIRFLGALMASNFVVIPVLVALLVQFLPATPMVRLGVLFVLLTPCIDYVVTFSHIGRADARSLLASTPALLIAQMLLLPVYLRLFLDDAAADLVQLGPFIHAFVWLIAVPLAAAAVVQIWAARSKVGARVAAGLGLLPVPATALVLFIVVAAVVPQLGAAIEAALRVVPLYVVFAVAAPLIGWTVARMARLEASAGRAVAFSSATRNSLVVLPLALAVPGAIPVLPAVIVTQTMVELVSSVIYMRLIPRFGEVKSGVLPAAK
ncbi:arsenic resistance protein [Thermomonas sp.]|uniref:arsenic resistance protein n=1 Tax=Thermomonas sp. TaxID=1971895 RepID=UPI00260C81B1|nr:arsenic resistance protein [Thermomonas sp.]